MSKERLEEIKQIRKNMQEYVNPDGSVEDYPKYDEQALLIVDDSHLDWLIEQAEQKQSLETTVDFYQSALRDADKRVQELETYVETATYIQRNLRRENKRYREKLESIALLINQKFWNRTELEKGIAKIINEALEKESE